MSIAAVIPRPSVADQRSVDGMHPPQPAAPLRATTRAARGDSDLAAGVLDDDRERLVALRGQLLRGDELGEVLAGRRGGVQRHERRAASVARGLRSRSPGAITEPEGQYQANLDAAFAAIADPTRQGILERLGRGDASISELAGTSR
jgi:hypothetical protein